MNSTMNDQPYSNRELDSKFQTIISMLEEHTTTHSDILLQVKYTNGRVRLLEKLMWLGMGGLAVLTFFFSQELLNFTGSQEQALVEALQQVDIPVTIDFKNLPQYENDI